MLIELSKFSDKLRQYRLILEKLTAEQPDYQRCRERLSKLSQRRRSSRKPNETECYMCNANIELESTDSFATCRGCERLVCRGESCCQWVDSIGIWECTGCQSNRVIQQKAGEWLLNQLTARLQQPGPVELSDGNLLGLGLESDDARSTVSGSTISANQRIKVREFIEELLSSMLHGPLDDVSVGQLMKNESYIRLFRKFHTRLSRCLYNLELSIHHSLMSDLPLWEGQQQHHSPSDQHFELKRLIQKILEEIAKLPELLNHSGLPLRPEEHLPYFDPKKYEQLVATAVLNKVVDDYRNPKNFTDVAGSKSNPALDINHNHQLAQEKEDSSRSSGALNAEALRQMSVTADDLQEAAGISYGASVDRRLSDTDESYLSDYIQRHKVPLPDLSDATTGSGSGADDDDLQSLKSNATDGTWEENWLFRKRQLKTTESSIAMLVPSPTEEVKALIGDQNADEISDLSEAGSDCEAGYESDGAAAGRPGTTSEPNTASSVSSSARQPDTDSLEVEGIEKNPPDSLVSVNSLPANEAALSEATNSQLVAERETKPPEPLAVESLLGDLISITSEPSSVEQVETTNRVLGADQPSADFAGRADPFELTNDSVITDDVKLLQRTEASDHRSSATEPCTNGHGDRKEVPIDRASHHRQPLRQQEQPHTHSNNDSSSNPVAACSVVVPAGPGKVTESSSVVDDSANIGSGNGSSGSSSISSSSRETNQTDNRITEENDTNPSECCLNATNEAPNKSNSMLLLTGLDSLSPPDSPVQQILSPHPIMMTITDVFDRLASSSPLTAISEEAPPALLVDVGETECESEPASYPARRMDSFEDVGSPLSTISEELPVAIPPNEEQEKKDKDGSLEQAASLDDPKEEEPVPQATQGVPFGGASIEAVFSPAESFQDDSEYRSVVSEPTNNSLVLVESFEELDPFASGDVAESESESLQRCDEEYSSLVEQLEVEEKACAEIVREEPSPELLQLHVSPPAALYVAHQEDGGSDFAELEQKALEEKVEGEPSGSKNPFDIGGDDSANPSQITLHPDLVTFDNNVPSPDHNPGIVAVTEQMRAYCEELKGLLNRRQEAEVEAEAESFPDPPVDGFDDPWELVESPETQQAREVFQEELRRAVEDPTQTEVRPCKDNPIRQTPLLDLADPFPSALEIGSLRMAVYSESLKGIESMEEASLIVQPPSPPSSLEVEGLLQDQTGMSVSGSVEEIAPIEEEEEPGKSVVTAESVEEILSVDEPVQTSEASSIDMEGSKMVANTEEASSAEEQARGSLSEASSSMEIEGTQMFGNVKQAGNTEQVGESSSDDPSSMEVDPAQTVEPGKSLANAESVEENISVDEQGQVSSSEEPSSSVDFEGAQMAEAGESLVKAQSVEETLSTEEPGETSTSEGSSSMEIEEEKNTTNTESVEKVVSIAEQVQVSSSVASKSAEIDDKQMVETEKKAPITESVEEDISIDEQVQVPSSLEVESTQMKDYQVQQPPLAEEEDSSLSAVEEEEEIQETAESNEPSIDIIPTEKDVPLPLPELDDRPSSVLGISTSRMAEYSERLKNIDRVEEAKRVDPVSSPVVEGSEIADLLVTVEDIPTNAEDPEEPLPDPIEVETDPTDEQLPSPDLDDFPPPPPESPDALEFAQYFRMPPCLEEQAIPLDELPLPEQEYRRPSVLEIGILRMAEYSESLKHIECVEEATPMDEQVEVLPTITTTTTTGSEEAFFVSSPEPSHHVVAVARTPSSEDPPSEVVATPSSPSSAEEATESGEVDAGPAAHETMLASIESIRSESKIEDTSMPFSDSELPSLSSPPFTSFSVTNNNNCMPTNTTEQVTTSISSSPPSTTYTTSTTIDIDTNPSNNHVSELSMVVTPPADAIQRPPSSPDAEGCSIIPAQKSTEQQQQQAIEEAVVSNGNHAAVSEPATVDESNSSQEQEAESLEPGADTLIPGSIAEREHLKWRNAKPIANNPYSPDALQRRLSEKSRPSSMIEIDRLLVKKDATAPNGEATMVLMDDHGDDHQPLKEPLDSGTEHDRSLQSVTSHGGLSEKKKIGREYYINDPARLRTGGGVVKQTLGVEQKHQHQLSHSTDDEKSLLLARSNVDDLVGGTELNSPSALHRSSSFGKPRDPSTENIFAARPIQVTADDPILRQGSKLSCLSTASREFFLVPVQDEQGASLMSSSTELSSPRSPLSSARAELDSLTLSEDSDVTRIYDLTTGEAKVIRPGTDTILQILPQSSGGPVNRAAPPSPLPATATAAGCQHIVPTTKARESGSSSQDQTSAFLRPGQFVVKPLSPETIKFFAPKRKLSFTGSTGNLLGSASGGHQPVTPMHSSLHIDFPARSTGGGSGSSDFSIIEKDVIDVLPSVKELAKCYSASGNEDSSTPPKPLYKPRDFLRQSSDVLNEEGDASAGAGGFDGRAKGQRQYSSTSSIAVRDEVREIRKINLDAYRQQSTFYPMAPGHSITARSLSKQIREHKTNVTDDHKVVVSQQEDTPSGSEGHAGAGGNGVGDGDNGRTVGEGGHASPERPSSPVFQPGHLKSSIEFFESLRNKP